MSIDDYMTREQGLRWRDIWTGTLFVVGIALAGTLALIIGRNTGLFTELRTVKIFVADIKGLTEGNLVSISGKKVGTVSGMEFIRRNDTAGIVLTLDIREEFFGLVTADSKARIKSLGVLGDKYVDISLGTARPAGNGAELAVAIDPGIDELTASAITTVDRIGQLSDRLTSVVGKIDRGEGTLGEMLTSDDLARRVDGTLDGAARLLASLDGTARTLTSGKGLVPTLLNDPKMSRQVAEFLESIDQVSTSLREGKGTLGRLATDDALYQNLVGLSERVDTLVTRLGNPASSFARFSNDPQLYDNLNIGLQSLDSLLKDLKANPGRYVKVTVF